MKTKLKNAIDCFLEKGSNVDGLYDLLIRGSGVDDLENLVEGWSDLDTSVIVEKINANVLKQVQELNREIKKVFPYKISITLVTKKDYLSAYHHHGAKPIYYSYLLSRRNEKKLPIELQRFDCLANIAYLIHDIRNRYVQLKWENVTALQQFYCHLARRSGHLIRNALFVLTGKVSETIEKDLFSKHFPNIDGNFLSHLESSKHRFKQISEFEKEINTIIDHLECVHEKLIESVTSSHPVHLEPTEERPLY